MGLTRNVQDRPRVGAFPETSPAVAQGTQPRSKPEPIGQDAGFSKESQNSNYLALTTTDPERVADSRAWRSCWFLARSSATSFCNRAFSRSNSSTICIAIAGASNFITLLRPSALRVEGRDSHSGCAWHGQTFPVLRETSFPTVLPCGAASASRPGLESHQRGSCSATGCRRLARN